tara:strand:- start:3662 stop:3886 length:225 start_codon:yes stop_codon:yes gene_type:complete
MTLPTIIREQWQKPVQWKVCQEDDAIEISDEDGDFVVSSMTHNHVSETIEEHIKKVQTAATLELLLSMSDKHEA